MYYDFEFDGKWLSDFGYMLCTFDSGYGAQTVQSGSKITFNKVKMNGGRHYSLLGVQYDECLTTTLNICKDPDCGRWDDNYYITDDDYRDIARWLNRSEFLKFRYADYEDLSAKQCYFNVSFNLNKITLSSRTIGIELNLETDAPFGYGEQESYVVHATDPRYCYWASVVSDELGHVFPSIEITCLGEGDLTIKNETIDCEMIVRNCKDGEIVSVNGDTFEICSSDGNHKLEKDFNFMYLPLANSYGDSNNKISVSIPCELKISYTPIIKDTPF